MSFHPVPPELRAMAMHTLGVIVLLMIVLPAWVALFMVTLFTAWAMVDSE